MSTRFAAKAIAVAFAASSTLLALAPAQAQAEAMSRSVSYADLDLSSDAGAAQLKRRVAWAATSVCGGAQRASLGEMKARSACRSAALASAEPQLQIVFAQAQTMPGQRSADAASKITIAAR